LVATSAPAHYAIGLMRPLHPNRCCLLAIDVQEGFLPAIHRISITSSEAILMELLGDARGPLFKETLAFLKG